MKIFIIDAVAGTIAESAKRADITAPDSEPELVLYGTQHVDGHVQTLTIGSHVRIVDTGAGHYFAYVCNPVNDNHAREVAHGLLAMLTAGGGDPGCPICQPDRQVHAYEDEYACRQNEGPCSC
jgi:hypothetical protein